MSPRSKSPQANKGSAWEARILKWNLAYRANPANQAVALRTPPPLVQVGPRQANGAFLARYVARGTPDFMGCAYGRCLAFDAKRISDGQRLPFAAIGAQVGEPSPQADVLDSIVAAGGLSFLLVDGEGFFALVWWDRLSPMYRRWQRDGGRPASIDLVDQINAPPLEGGPLVEPLSPVEGWLPLVRQRIGVA